MPMPAEHPDESMSLPLPLPPSPPTLDATQLSRLCEVANSRLCICHNFQVLSQTQFTVYDTVSRLEQALAAAGIPLRDIRLEGSAASYCLCGPTGTDTYNDIDVVFHLESQDREQLLSVRELVLGVLNPYLPAATQALPAAVRSSMLFEKMFVTPAAASTSDDAWALFTLSGMGGGCFPSLDLKFVQHIRHPFQFSMDSLQIILDLPALDWLRDPSSQDMLVLRLPAETTAPTNPVPSTDPASPSPAPTAPEPPIRIAYASSFGDAGLACDHLLRKVIYVSDEAEMASVHGGGLLKYISLRLKGFRTAKSLDQGKLERYMCNRFMIDFGAQDMTRVGTPVQLQRIRDYLDTHFQARLDAQINFLDLLRATIKRVGPHDRDHLLHNIQYLRQTTVYARNMQQHAAALLAMSTASSSSSSSSSAAAATASTASTATPTTTTTAPVTTTTTATTTKPGNSRQQQRQRNARNSAHPQQQHRRRSQGPPRFQGPPHPAARMSKKSSGSLINLPAAGSLGADPAARQPLGSLQSGSATSFPPLLRASSVPNMAALEQQAAAHQQPPPQQQPYFAAPPLLQPNNNAKLPGGATFSYSAAVAGRVAAQPDLPAAVAKHSHATQPPATAPDHPAAARRLSSSHKLLSCTGAVHPHPAAFGGSSDLVLVSPKKKARASSPDLIVAAR